MGNVVYTNELPGPFLRRALSELNRRGRVDPDTALQVLFLSLDTNELREARRFINRPDSLSKERLEEALKKALEKVRAGRIGRGWKSEFDSFVGLTALRGSTALRLV